MTNDDDRGLDEALDAIIEGALSEKLGLGAKAEWVPYQGPQGGVGWENTETGDKHYGDTPPGGTPEGIPDSASEIEEQIESGELTQEDLEEAYGGGDADGDADGGGGPDIDIGDGKHHEIREGLEDAGYNIGMNAEEVAEAWDAMGASGEPPEELQDGGYRDTVAYEASMELAEVDDEEAAAVADRVIDELGGGGEMGPNAEDRAKELAADITDGDTNVAQAAVDELEDRGLFDEDGGGEDTGDPVESVRDIDPRDTAHQVHDELVEDGIASLDSYSGEEALEDAVLDAAGLDDVTDLGDTMDDEGRLILEDVKDAVRDEVRQISAQTGSDVTDKLSTEEELNEKLAERIQEKLDERLDFSDRVAAKASWVPYQGPQGGVGWRNTETGEKIYDDEPPGGTPGDLPDDLDELRDRVESGELTEDDVREAVADQSAMDAEGDPTETGVVTAEDLEEGETVMIDGVEAEVSRKSDMGGGFYIAGRDESGEVHTARVGPDEEFGQPVDDPPGDGEPDDELSPGVLEDVSRDGYGNVEGRGSGAASLELNTYASGGPQYELREGTDPAYGDVLASGSSLDDLMRQAVDEHGTIVLDDEVGGAVDDQAGGDEVEELDGDQVEEVIADHVSDGGPFYQGTAGARGSSSELDALEERLEGTDHTVVDRGPAGAFYDEAEKAEVVKEDSKAGQAYLGKEAVEEAGVEASNLMANQSGLQVGGRDADLDRAKEAVAEATDMDLVHERDDFVKFEPSEIRARNEPLELRSDYRDRATRGSAGSTSESLGGGEVRMNVHGGQARDMAQAATKAIKWLDRHDPDPDEERLSRLKELKSDIDAQNDPMRDTEIRTDAKNLEALAESGGDIDTYMTEREDVTDPDDDRHRDMTRTLNTAKTVLGAAQQDAAGADQKARIVDDVAGALGEALRGDSS